MAQSNGQHNSKIAFDDDVPRRGPELFIKRLQANECKHFTAWGTRIRGIWVHWNASTGKSEPHYEENCKSCTIGLPKRWKGFLHVYSSEDKAEQFLEFTPTSAEALLHQISDPTELRGTVFQARRTAAKNGRLQVKIMSQVPNLHLLPKEKDPRLSILKLWGVPDIETTSGVCGEVFEPGEGESDGG